MKRRNSLKSPLGLVGPDHFAGGIDYSLRITGKGQCKFFEFSDDAIIALASGRVSDRGKS